MKVLMISEDQEFFKECAGNFKKNGHEILTASKGSDGFEIYARECKNIQAIIIDEDLPDVTISHLARLMYNYDGISLVKAVKIIIGYEQYRDDISVWITDELFYKNKPDAAKELVKKVERLHGTGK